MEIKAIIFESNAGHTKEYAGLLSKELGIPACELGEAKKNFAKGSPVLFMGWLMAGTIKGYKQASKQYVIQAVCGVGMAHNASQIDDMKKTNKLPSDLPVFYLQGGFEIDRLHGIYKLMMQTMSKGVLSKEPKNQEEAEMFELMKNGGNCVSVENLSEIINWYKQNNSL